MPRTSPVRVIDVPKGIGAAGAGCWRDIIDTLNQVERSPSALVTAPPLKDGPVAAPRPSDGSVITERRLTRPVGSVVVWRSRIDPFTFSACAKVCALIGTVQSWYGESTSYGSGTATRYGTGATPQPSEIDSVSPPELEKKNVDATLPLNITICPVVASTAAVVAGVSWETPRYIWLRVSPYTSKGAAI